jgi:transglutaminase-like putative cysteine protease
MRVAIAHTTRLEYTADVVEGVMDVRLGPFTDEHQRWGRFDPRVSPPAAVRRYADGFDNVAHLITIARPHRHVEVVVQSEVETLLDDPFRRPVIRPRPLGPSDLADSLMPSQLVPRDPDLEAMAAPHRPSDPEGAFDAVRALTDLVYNRFTYRQNVTNVGTTVAEVLSERIGVCQDFAHVLLGLCRSIGIPARYVSGYIVATSQSQSQGRGGQSQSQSQTIGPSRGAGASHAWIEAWTPTHGWRGFDPTNNLLASEHHVKMALGRDYADVPPTRGAFRGLAEEHLSVEVVTRVLD